MVTQLVQLNIFVEVYDLRNTQCVVHGNVVVTGEGGAPGYSEPKTRPSATVLFEHYHVFLETLLYLWSHSSYNTVQYLYRSVSSFTDTRLGIHAVCHSRAMFKM